MALSLAFLQTNIALHVLILQISSGPHDGMFLIAPSSSKQVRSLMAEAPSPLPKFDGTPPMGYLWLWLGK